ncbi:MAG: ArsR/SmtB family transcription factor [Spirochaetota bacterium]
MKTDSEIEKLANQFKILGDKTRLKILMVLKTQEMPVHKIVERIETTQANVSKHLKILFEYGLVKKRHLKSSVLYSIKRDCIFEICDILYSSSEDDKLLKKSINIINENNSKS